MRLRSRTQKHVQKLGGAALGSLVACGGSGNGTTKSSLVPTPVTASW